MISRKLCQLLLLLFLTVTAGQSLAADDIDRHRDCSYCGMDRKAYGYSRMLLRYADGAAIGVCSLHCAVTAMNADTRRPRAILVADRDSRELIPAETAIWVLGGRKRGVMTPHPKWAFATKGAAEAFIAANGGELADWGRALAAARRDAAPPAGR